ncbi:MAG TPA: ABC transporter permease [Candidatus Dormibacteraeota bacterium]|nr:ABC transporter permease [Candidatus Dormibacteraeota bacterium]
MATSPNSSMAGRLIVEMRAAFRKDVRVYLRNPSLILSEFITLPAWFVLFGVGVAANFIPKGTVTSTLGTTSAFQFLYWGFVFLIVFSTSIWGIGQYIRTEQLQGTLEQLFLAPISRVNIIFGRFARVFFSDLAIIAYTALLIGGLGHQQLSIGNPLLFSLVFAILYFGVLGFGLIFAAVAFRIKSFNILSNLTQFLVIGLCGVFFPLTALPAVVRPVSLAIPFTYFADLLRFAAAGSSTILDPALEVLVAFGLSVALFILGLVLFRVMEKSAQSRGIIGTH